MGESGMAKKLLDAPILAAAVAEAVVMAAGAGAAASGAATGAAAGAAANSQVFLESFVFTGTNQVPSLLPGTTSTNLDSPGSYQLPTR